MSSVKVNPETGEFVPVIAVQEQPELETEYDESSTENEFTVEDVLVNSDSALYPPENFSVISQTVRVNSGGTTVVDVVIEVADGTESAEYEPRLTKA